ncbi:MAG: hypothetical protein PHE59_05110 [Patescibacteria group bacterium]|nr:hypothetical protein [Patescibacteria group bacterium]
MVEILGRIEIVVGPDIGRDPPLLDEHQKGLVRVLILKTIARGGWCKKSLTRTLEEEMHQTARQMGGETWEQIDQLLKGIWMTAATPPEPGEGLAANKELGISSPESDGPAWNPERGSL